MQSTKIKLLKVHHINIYDELLYILVKMNLRQQLPVYIMETNVFYLTLKHGQLKIFNHLNPFKVQLLAYIFSKILLFQNLKK